MKKRIAILLAAIMLVTMLPAAIVPVDATSGENVIISVPWEKINNCGHQPPYSTYCQAYCWAYCRIILDNQPHSFQDYWTGTQAKLPSVAGYNDGKNVSTTTEMLRIIYDNINSGHPVMLHVRGTQKKDGTYNNHYVVAIGYRAGSDPNNLSPNDILILNPSNRAINSSAGSNETYTYLSSCTLTQNRFWTVKSGTGGKPTTTSTGVNLATPNKNPVSPPKEPEVVSVTPGNWKITVPANYKLVCYDSASAVKSSIYYISAKTAPYTLTCTQKATLSDGRIRYFFVSGDGKNLWFDYTSGMSVPDNNVSYTVSFDANGGSVFQSSKVVTPGQKYGDLPMPSRNGYIFDGWFTTASGGVQITAASTVSLTSNRTLYAHWTKEPPTNPPQNTPPDIVKPTSFDYSGNFGVNNALTWGLNTETGIMVLSGNGRMKDWSNGEYRPWAKLRNTVTGVLIEDGIQNLSGPAFAQFENMTSISIPESVTEIGASVFSRAYSLASIKLPQNLTTIGNGAFSECTSLRSITIPQNVDFIETGAFSRCTNLESIYFCGNAPSYFGDNGIVRLNMFNGCKNLTVYYPANSSGWAPIIEKYTDVTWKTWNPGNTSSSSSASNPTWGTWSAWSTTPYTASSTREVETRQVKVSDAYTEYRYGLWRNDDNAGWCPNYGAQFSSSNSSWYEAYSSWSKTRMYQNTGHKAYCDGSNHNHTHVSGYDSSGRANWDIYSDDGTFTGWGRLYYYWEETRTIPAVYETQYRYRDLISA